MDRDEVVPSSRERAVRGACTASREERREAALDVVRLLLELRADVGREGEGALAIAAGACGEGDGVRARGGVDIAPPFGAPPGQ